LAQAILVRTASSTFQRPVVESMAKVPVANEVLASGATSPSRVTAVKKQVAALQASGVKTLEGGVQKVGDFAVNAKQKTAKAAADRGVQVGIASAVSGGVVVGAGGAATGFAAGGLAGAAAGVLPALFTFGLSIPIGAAIGAGCGTVAGGAVGGTVGFTGAGAAGYGAYTKRVEIKSAIVSARAKLSAAIDRTQSTSKLYAAKTKKKLVDTGVAVKRHLIYDAMLVREVAWTLRGLAVHHGKIGAEKTMKVVKNKEVQGTAASATGGAVALGAGGAATGVVAGGTLGAAAGLLPALFTFGLSIPVFAVVGGGCGLVAGSTLGGATGAVAGAGGYQAYTRRATIQAFVGKKSEQARTSIGTMSQRVRGKVDSAMLAMKKKN